MALPKGGSPRDMYSVRPCECDVSAEASLRMAVWRTAQDLVSPGRRESIRCVVSHATTDLRRCVEYGDPLNDSIIIREGRSSSMLSSPTAASKMKVQLCALRLTLIRRTRALPEHDEPSTFKDKSPAEATWPSPPRRTKLQGQSIGVHMVPPATLAVSELGQAG
ncbi:hypothetical protein K466DRAFT_210725 [Polyporus arcularius HHB13444]|uniref:Uncharacterized protein n=1 Tax=Polyporus arcularius HHB13444 TaxID=1314778 RepID=A0A5C3P790_9APHY|nr:hypothetical protein K466DRAFT_210725 [Polyporus arcularius HHB13444]